MSGVLLTGTSPVVNAEEILQGTYTREQASKGERIYKASCQNCHAIREYKGLIQKSEKSSVQITAYYDLIRQSMPQDAPGSLSSEQYLNLMAFILSLNGFPAADTPDQ